MSLLLREKRGGSTGGKGKREGRESRGSGGKREGRTIPAF